MRSYSAWVPMNFTSKRPNANDTWTTNRYLLPPKSKITRLSPTKSTVPPNCRFISAGLAQCALAATATQAALDRGKSQLHASGAPFIDEIKADEDELQRLTVITTETEQAFLVRINTVKVLALGEDGRHGALVTVCQTILVEIRQVIVVVTVNPGGGDRESDIKKP